MMMFRIKRKYFGHKYMENNIVTHLSVVTLTGGQHKQQDESIDLRYTK